MSGQKATAYKNQFTRENYDTFLVTVPKGIKEKIKEFAGGKNETVNGLVNRLLQTEMGLTDEEWRKIKND